MPLNHTQWTRIEEILSEVRGMGCAVCVISPDDVESTLAEEDGTTGISNVKSETFVVKHRGNLESLMASRGNDAVVDLLREDGFLKD